MRLQLAHCHRRREVLGVEAMTHNELLVATFCMAGFTPAKCDSFLQRKVCNHDSLQLQLASASCTLCITMRPEHVSHDELDKPSSSKKPTPQLFNSIYPQTTTSTRSDIGSFR